MEVPPLPSGFMKHLHSTSKTVRRSITKWSCYHLTFFGMFKSSMKITFFFPAGGPRVPDLNSPCLWIMHWVVLILKFETKCLGGMAFKDSHHGVSMSSRPYTPRRLFSNFESNRSWNSEVIAIGSVSDRSTPAYVYTSNFLISFKSSFERCWNMLKLDIEPSENNARRTSTLQHTQHTQPKSLEISRLQLVHMCLSLGRGVCPGFTRRGSSCKYTLYIYIYIVCIIYWTELWTEKLMKSGMMDSGASFCNHNLQHVFMALRCWAAEGWGIILRDPGDK